MIGKDRNLLLGTPAIEAKGQGVWPLMFHRH